MQSLLVLVFAAAVGLAALVTRRVRMSMRVELGEQKTVGRLVVRLPVNWLSSPVTLEKGEGIEVEEPPSETAAPVRRLRIMRQKSDGFAPPLEHLYRSGQIKADALKGLTEGREGYSISNLAIAGWPGQMLTMMSSPRAGVVHKDVLACAMMPGSQALVIALEGLGPLDASDKELVRQMSENVSLAMQAPPPPADAAAPVELSDQISVQPPSRYLVVPHGDVNELQRHLIFDGSRGSAWVAIDLVSCVFFADDGDEAFLTMLAARDPEWRSGSVKRPGLRTLMRERVESTSPPTHFASRAYLTANGDGRALLVVMRGGAQDQRAMDAAWQSIASSVKFAGTKDLSSLLVNGAQGARELGAVFEEIDDEPRSEDWSIWDDSENADKELWSQVKWQVTRKPGEADVIAGSRTSKPTNPYTNDTAYEQQWSAATDLSKYQVTTYREVRRAGNQLPRQTIEQRVSVDHGGRITMSSQLRPEPVEIAAPAQYVPGALLPLLVRQIAERPSLIRTESFVGAQTLAPPSLLTLFVTRLTDSPVRLDEKGEPMDCVSVSVNGTGVVSRWYYGPDETLKFIDFAGNMKAQAQPGKK